MLKEIQTSPVQVVGIGIKYLGVAHQYKKSAVVDNVDNLEQVLLEQLSNELF